MDPTNPEILYATLYARQRTPWGFSYGVSATNGEDVGGIFKSTNGGATWKKLGGGLPGQTGRIGRSAHHLASKVCAGEQSGARRAGEVGGGGESGG